MVGSISHVGGLNGGGGGGLLPLLDTVQFADLGAATVPIGTTQFIAMPTPIVSDTWRLRVTKGNSSGLIEGAFTLWETADMSSAPVPKLSATASRPADSGSVWQISNLLDDDETTRFRTGDAEVGDWIEIQFARAFSPLAAYVTARHGSYKVDYELIGRLPDGSYSAPIGALPNSSGGGAGRAFGFGGYLLAPILPTMELRG